MSRRYRVPAVSTVRVTRFETGEPAGFRWRGRRYEVREVLVHWVEATSWWHGLTQAGSNGRAGSSSTGSNGRAAQRDVWRVEAVSHTGTSGVYDLAVVADEWQLLRVID